MGRASQLVLLMLAPAVMWAQSGTITLDKIDIELEGRMFRFTPGGNNVLDIEPTVSLQQRNGKYTAFVSHDVNSPTREVIVCDGVDTVPENSHKSETTTKGIEQDARIRSNVAVGPGQFSVNLPPRADPAREVVYTFSCGVLGGGAGPFYATTGEIVVRQQLDIRQSVAVVEVTPNPSQSLTPGRLQNFTGQANWEDNIVFGASLRLMAFDSAGEELGFGPRTAGLGRVPQGDGTFTTQGSVEVTLRVAPASDGFVRLRLDLIERLRVDGQPLTRVLAAAPDIVYGADLVCPAPTGPLSRLSPKGQAPTSCSDYTIQHIEAVQVIQDISNSVPLVAGKPTWLRIYLGADGAPPENRVVHPRMPVSVNVRTKDGAVTSFDFDESGEFGLARPRPDDRDLQVKRASREILSKLGHFSIELPPELIAAGEIEVEARINVEADLLAPESDITNNTALAKFEFIETRPVIVEYLEVCGPECGDEMGNEFLLQHFAPTETVRYSAFTSDAIRPGRADLPELLSQVAIFTLGRLVDYFIVWVPDSSDFEVPEEAGILRSLNVQLQALGAAPLVFAEAEKSEHQIFLRNQQTRLNEEVAGTLPVALGLVSPQDCRNAADFSPVTAIEWRGKSRTPHDIVSPFGPKEMNTSCAGDAIRGFHPSQGVYLGLFDRLRSDRAEIQIGQRKQQGASGEYFLVSGTAGADGGAISPIVRANLSVDPSGLPSSGDVCVESQSNGSPRIRQCVQRSSRTRDSLPFIFPIPFDASVSRIALFVDGQEVDSRATSASAPMVEIVSPTIGSTINAADQFTLSWTASDADGDLVESTVLYSSDGGASWTPLRFRLEGNSAEIDLTRISGGESVLFRVQATDGFRTGESTVGPVNVIQHPRIEADAVVDLGSTGDGFPLQGFVSIRNTGSGRLTVHAVGSNNPAFAPLQALPMTIEAGHERSITVDFTPIGPGDVSALLTVESDDAATPGLDVELRVRVRDTSEPILAILDEPQTLAFPAVIVGDENQGGLTVINQGTPELDLEVIVEGNGFRLIEDAGTSSLRVEQAANVLVGGEQRDIVVGFAPPSNGEFAGALTLNTGDAMRPQVRIALSGEGREAPDRATINPGGIVNAASFASGVAPGGIGSIFGVQLADGVELADRTPLPLRLRGTEVFVGGWPAPLFFVSPNQINFQIPFEVTGRSAAPVGVRRDGVDSLSVAAMLRVNAPGVFVNPNTAEPIVIRADGSLITAANPAQAGDVLIVFATGLGAVSNPPLTGAASLASPLASAGVLPTVTVGGSAAQVFFAGLTPNFVGLAQINIQLPDALPASNSLEVVVEFDGSSSQPVNLPVGSR